ncbi:MAG: complex I subunit 1/NuoH family protein [Phycisphaerales bacterium]
MPQPDFFTGQLVVSALTIGLVIHLILIGCAYCIYFERKISAWMQDRLGPNRCGLDFGLPALSFLKGMYGVGQPLADGIKFMLKEDYTPHGADKALFTLAPAVIVIPALIGFAIIPWGGTWMMPEFTLPLLNWTIGGGPVVIAGANINIGIVFLLAVASLGIYGVTLGGWASNNKYSFLGSLRAASQMLSYEIPMGLSILTVLLVTGTLVPMSIVEWQHHHGWLALSQPVACIIYMICILAECNRAPFDNAECEQELVGGYHTEYSSMKFALFFLAEYAHMITNSAIFAVLFLGGHSLAPFIDLPLLRPEDTTFLAVLAKFGVMFGKVCGLIAFMMVVRWTLPRLRFDQVMSAAWQGLIPISLAVVVMNAVLIYLGATAWYVQLGANVVLALVIVAVQPLIPKPTNRKLPMAGSRFSPLDDRLVNTRPTLSVAREDRPGPTAATLGAG